MSLFDRATVARIVIATAIVLPPVVGFQRAQQAQERADRAEQVAKIAARSTGQVAQEKVERLVADCQAANEQRLISIASTEAVIKFATAGTPPLDLRRQLLLAAFVQRANRQIETATKPKTCTIAALHLEALAEIARLAQTKTPGGEQSSGSGGVAPASPPPIRPGRRTSTPTITTTTTTTTVCGCETTTTHCVKTANHGACRGKP